eukprot:scaffold24489_cov36-Phaeocystis_antarctica.AAC.1
MCRHSKGEQRQDYPFSRVAPGSTLFAGLAQLPTRVQKVAAWRVWVGEGLQEEIAGERGR